MSTSCEFKVLSGIMFCQSIEYGIQVWHEFILKNILEQDPCPVCYNFLDPSQKIPKSVCQTCHNKFHSSCLSKWFSYTIVPTCPFCNCTWKRNS